MDIDPKKYCRHCNANTLKPQTSYGGWIRYVCDQCGFIDEQYNALTWVLPFFHAEMFAGAVRDFRGSQSLLDMSKETGLSMSTLSRAEQGYLIGPGKFLALCEQMGVDPLSFFDDGSAQRVELWLSFASQEGGA